jgi:urea carboxylase
MSKFETRYSFGGDEFLFVELDEAFVLDNVFRIIASKRKIKEKNLVGIYDVCAGNASILIRFNPDVISPQELKSEMRTIIQETADNFSDILFKSRIVEIPIYFEDPWTYETVMKFRHYHQDPSLTDIEYCAKINGYNSTKSFINAMTDNPYLVINVGFVPGLPWCYQLVPQEKQIEVPKYLRPRTYTPERALFYAGAVAGFYPAEGTGGAQIFGIAATPFFDKSQKLKDFKESMVFPNPGDIFNFRSITREEYDAIRAKVEDGTFEYFKKGFEFTPKDIKNFEGFANIVKRRLYND